MDGSEYSKLKTTLSDFSGLDVESEKRRKESIRIFHGYALRDLISLQDILDTVARIILNDSDVNALLALKIVYDILKADRPLNSSMIEVYFDTIPKTLYQNVLSYDFSPPRTFKSGNYHAISSVNFAMEMPCFLMLLSNACPQSLIKFYDPLLVILFRFMESRVNQKCENPELVMSCQIRTLSFVCYTFKNCVLYSSHISTECFSQRTVNLIKNYLASLPSHACGQRRSILEVLRSFASQCRVVKELIPLLDENFLAGAGYTQNEFCRPLALQVILEILVALKGNYSLVNIDGLVHSLVLALEDQSLMPNAHLAAAKSLSLLLECMAQHVLLRVYVAFSYSICVSKSDTRYIADPPHLLWLWRLLSSHLYKGFGFLPSQLQDRVFVSLAHIYSVTCDYEILDNLCVLIITNQGFACRCFNLLTNEYKVDLILKRVHDLSKLTCIDYEAIDRFKVIDIKTIPDLHARLVSIYSDVNMSKPFSITYPIQFDLFDTRIVNDYLQSVTCTNDFELRPEVWLERLKAYKASSSPFSDDVLHYLLALEACQPEWSLVLLGALSKIPPKNPSAVQISVFKRLLLVLPASKLESQISLSEWLSCVAKGPYFKSPFYMPKFDMSYYRPDLEESFLEGVYSEYIVSKCVFEESKESSSDALARSFKDSQTFYSNMIDKQTNKNLFLKDWEIYFQFASLTTGKYCPKALREMAFTIVESGGKKDRTLFTLLCCSTCCPPTELEPLINSVRNLAYYAIINNHDIQDSMYYYPSFIYLTMNKQTAHDSVNMETDDIKGLNDLVSFIEENGSTEVFCNAIRGSVLGLDLRPTYIVGMIKTVQFLCLLSALKTCPWNEMFSILLDSCFTSNKSGAALYALTHVICTRQKNGMLDLSSIPIDTILSAIFSVVKSRKFYIRTLESKIAIRALQVISTMLVDEQQQQLGQYLYRALYSPSPFQRTLSLKFYYQDKYGPSFLNYMKSYDEEYKSISNYGFKDASIVMNLSGRARVIKFFEDNMKPLNNSIYDRLYNDSISQIESELKNINKPKLDFGQDYVHNTMICALEGIDVTLERVTQPKDGLIKTLIKLLYSWTLSLDASKEVVGLKLIIEISKILGKLGNNFVKSIDLEMKTLPVYISNLYVFTLNPQLITNVTLKHIIKSSSLLLQSESNHHLVFKSLYNISKVVSGRLKDVLNKFFMELVFGPVPFEGFSFLRTLQSSSLQAMSVIVSIIENLQFNILESHMLITAINIFSIKGTNLSISSAKKFIRAAFYKRVLPFGDAERLVATIVNYYQHSSSLVDNFILTDDEINTVLDMLTPSEINFTDSNIIYAMFSHLYEMINFNKISDKRLVEAIVYSIKLVSDNPFNAGPYFDVLRPVIELFLRLKSQLLPFVFDAIISDSHGCPCNRLILLVNHYKEGEAKYMFRSFDIFSEYFFCAAHGETLLVKSFNIVQRLPADDLVKYGSAREYSFNLVKFAKEVVLSDKRLSIYSYGLLLLSTYAINNKDIAFMNEVLELLLQHTDSEYRQLRLDTANKLIKEMSNYGYSSLYILINKIIKELQKESVLLQNLSALCCLLSNFDFVGNISFDLKPFLDAILLFEAGIEKLYMTSSDRECQDKLPSIQTAKEVSKMGDVDQYKKAAIYLFIFANTMGIKRPSITESAFKFVLSWPTFANVNHDLLNKLLSCNCFMEYPFDLLSRMVNLDDPKWSTLNIDYFILLTKLIYVRMESLDYSYDTCSLLGKTYFNFLMRHFSTPQRLMPSDIPLYYTLTKMPYRMIDLVFNNENLEKLVSEITIFLTSKNSPLLGLSHTACLFLSHTFLSHGINKFPHKQIFSVLLPSILTPEAESKLSEGILLLDGIEHKLLSARDVNCPILAFDKQPFWGKHWPSQKDVPHTPIERWEVSWFFMDYLYGLFATFEDLSNDIIKVFGHLAKDSNPSSFHSLILATHPKAKPVKNPSPRKLVRKLSSPSSASRCGERGYLISQSCEDSTILNCNLDKPRLCWGRWFGPCSAEHRCFGNSAYDLFLYKLLKEPVGLHELYHRISRPILDTLFINNFVDAGNPHTFGSAIYGCFSPFKDIRDYSLSILDRLAPKDIPSRLEYLFKLPIPTLPRVQSSVIAFYLNVLSLVIDYDNVDEYIEDSLDYEGIFAGDNAISKRLRAINMYDKCQEIIPKDSMALDITRVKAFKRYDIKYRRDLWFASPAIARNDWFEFCSKFVETNKGITSSLVLAIARSNPFRISPITSLVQGSLLWNPKPLYPLELLHYLSMYHGEYHEALSPLISQIANNSHQRTKSIKLASDLYFITGDRDYGFGALRLANNPTATLGIVYEQHEFYLQAMRVYQQIIKQISDDYYNSNLDSINNITSFICCRGWVESTKALGKWVPLDLNSNLNYVHVHFSEAKAINNFYSMLEGNVTSMNAAISSSIKNVVHKSLLVPFDKTLGVFRQLEIEHDILSSIRSIAIAQDKKSPSSPLPCPDSILRLNYNMNDSMYFLHLEASNCIRLSKILKVIGDKVYHLSTSLRYSSVLIDIVRFIRKLSNFDEESNKVFISIGNSIDYTQYVDLIVKELLQINPPPSLVFGLASQIAKMSKTSVKQKEGMIDKLLRGSNSNDMTSAAEWISASDDSFKTALKLEPTNARSWLSWAKLTDGDLVKNKISANAIMGYLAGCSLDPQAAPLYLGRVLWLLSSSGGDSTILETFGRYAQSVHVQCWEYWIPTMLSLNYPQVHTILIKILKSNPSSYFHLLFNDPKRGLRVCMDNLIHMDWFCREMVKLANPSPIDELSCVVDTLFEEILGMSLEDSLPESVRDLIYETLPEKLSELNFDLTPTENPILMLLRIKKLLQSSYKRGVIDRYAIHSFEGGYVSPIVDWEKLSIAIPGGISKAIVVDVKSKSGLIRRSHHLLKQVVLIGDDGLERNYLLQPLASENQISQMRYNALESLLNIIFKRNRYTSMRSVHIPVWPIYPLNSCFALAEHQAPSHSLLALFREQFERGDTRVLNDCISTLHKVLWEKGCDKKELFEFVSDIVPDNSVSSAFSDLFGLNASILHKSVRNFATTYAARSILRFIFGMGLLKPIQIMIGPDATTWQLDFKFNYSMRMEGEELNESAGSYDLDSVEDVPFRFTPNIDNLLGPICKLGYVPALMYSVCQALEVDNFHVFSILANTMLADLKVLGSGDSTVAIVKRIQSGLIRLKANNNEPIDNRIQTLIQFSSNRDTLASLVTNLQAWV